MRTNHFFSFGGLWWTHSNHFHGLFTRTINAVSGSLQTENEPQFPHSAWLSTTQAQDIADCEPHIRALSPDWIITDHYALSAIWQTAAKNICSSKIMALDDLHDRPHAAHLLPETCRVLAGTRYALLRDEFAMFREISLARKKKPFQAAWKHKTC